MAKSRSFDVTPEDAGLPRADAEELERWRCRTQCKSVARIFWMARPALTATSHFSMRLPRSIVAGKAETLKDGVALAAQSIDSGRAKAALDALVAVSNRKSSLKWPISCARSKPTSAKKYPPPKRAFRSADLKAKIADQEHAARISQGVARQTRCGRLCADRRDQKSQPLQRLDPC